LAWTTRSRRTLVSACERRSRSRSSCSGSRNRGLLYAFFQSAYHLRDWLLNSGGASKAEIEALFADSPCLRFCADVCNGSKHFVLDPKRHTTARIGRMLEYVPPLPGSDVDGMRPTVLAFQDHGGYVDFVPIDGLLRDCTTTWQQFCSTR
jgi:hypothetical protein